MDGLVTTRIYTLSDPATGRVRYVGKTVCSLKKRLREHVCRGRADKPRCYRDNWIESLGALQPTITEVEVVTGLGQDGCEVERRWIARLRSDGCRLTNLTDGGDGAPGYVPTPETRIRMAAAQKGKRLSPEARAKISAAQRGRKMSPHVAAILAKYRSMPRSPEMRANMAAAQRGKKQSAETIAKRSATTRGKSKPLSPAHRAAIVASNKAKKTGKKQTPESIAKRVLANTGQKRTAETRAKMSVAQRGKTFSAEARARMSASARARRRSVS